MADARSGGIGLGGEDVEQVAIGGAVFDVTLDLDALIGLFFLQWRVEHGGLRRVDDAAEFLELPGDLLRHWASLRPRRCRRYDQCCEYGQSRFQ